jgi:hypothetical protein
MTVAPTTTRAASPARAWAWSVGALLCALVLLAAAGLKAHGGRSHSLPVWTWAAIVAEWVVALWLLAGWTPRRVRAVVLVLFAVFVGVSIWRWRQGLDCGCFGALSLHPGWTIALDVSLLVLLAWARPAPGPVWRVPRLAAAVLLGLAVPIGVLTWPITPAHQATVPGGAVVDLTDTSQLVGRPTVLVDYVKGAGNLRRGRHDILIANTQCGRCWSAIEACRGRGVVLVDLLGALDPTDESYAGFRLGELAEDLELHVTPPLLLTVEDGRIVDVHEDFGG